MFNCALVTFSRMSPMINILLIRSDHTCSTNICYSSQGSIIPTPLLPPVLYAERCILKVSAFQNKVNKIVYTMYVKN